MVKVRKHRCRLLHYLSSLNLLNEVFTFFPNPYCAQSRGGSAKRNHIFINNIFRAEGSTDYLNDFI